MACIYDETIFQKYRKLAITDVKDLVIDKTYYSNSLPPSFKILKILTEQEFADMRGWMPGKYDSIAPAWIIYNERGDAISLHDNNIDASYNPWLIFDNEEACNACLEELKVSIVSDFDDWDSFDDNYWDSLDD